MRTAALLKKPGKSLAYAVATAMTAMALLTTVGGAPAQAAGYKGSDVQRVTVGTTPGLLGAGYVWVDHRGESGCSSRAYLQAWAQFNVGAVTTSGVYVRSIKVSSVAGNGGSLQGSYMIRGNGGTVRQFPYDGTMPRGGGVVTKTYTINATIPWDGGRRVYFGKNYATNTDTGGAACGGSSSFRWYLER